MTDSSIRVLLIEDSQAEADLVAALLSESPADVLFDIHHVQRLTAGLGRLAEAAFDVVLLDLNLPDSSGLAGYAEVSEAAPQVPVIIFSNVADQELARRAVRKGAQDYLMKREVDAKLLRHAIRYSIERKRTEDALRESEERYALAVEGANDAIWDWNLKARSAYFSPRWRAMLELGDGPVGDTIDEWFGRVHRDDLDGLREALAQHIRGDSDHFQYEHRLYTARGDFLWVLTRGLVVRGSDGAACRFAGSMTDITQRKQAESQLLHDAMHDALTGLPNRGLCLDRLDIALRQYRRDEEHRFAVLYFDLNRFKYINDSLGHSVGDALLVAVARRLEKFLRPGDTLGRLGGDEFAILLNDVEGLGSVTHISERVHELLAREFHIDGHEVFTSASIGVAMASPKYQQAEEVLRDADLAMYKAKHEGKGGFEVFDSDMHESALAQLKLETDLRRACDRDEFVLHYQPIVSVTDGRILSFEALLRWQHPDLGLIYPEHFISAAEEMGLIVPIGWWVLEEACRQAADWQRMFPVDPPLGISVNLSGKVFLKPNMARQLFVLLERCQLDPSTLRLEITETAIFEHLDAAVDELARLRDAGVELHIDDFGTGYSSLSYLQRFSYDTLKIDRSFVQGMHLPGEAAAIVKTLIALGRMLNMNVIAEGVETSEQLRQLRDLQCPEAQGYWFSKPISHPDVHLLLGNGGLKA
ncbi:MAG: EAL domain-containing protein [Gammaproteobacteria bacterium]|nr:EAL domain-containing protein [Gammaproteobacteria bacterium]